MSKAIDQSLFAFYCTNSFLGSISRVKSGTFYACAAAFSAFSPVNHENGDYSRTPLYGLPLNTDTSR